MAESLSAFEIARSQFEQAIRFLPELQAGLENQIREDNARNVKARIVARVSRARGIWP